MTTLPSDARAEMVALPTVGFSTRVLVAGPGVPVLLLHGNPHCATEWRYVVGELGGQGQCISPDLPGFGACEEPPPSFDYSRAANEAFLDDLLAAKKVTEPLVLVVHDIGGVIGIPWAAKHLDRIRGLVITNTVIFEKFPWFPVARTWQRGGARAKLGMWLMGVAGGALFRRTFARISPDLSEHELEKIGREFALDDKSKRSTLRLFAKMVPHDYFEGAKAALDALYAKKPVRVVWGLGDPFIPDAYADSLPEKGRTVVKGGGHWIPVTKAGLVAGAIREVMAAG